MRKYQLNYKKNFKHQKADFFYAFMSVSSHGTNPRAEIIPKIGQRYYKLIL